MPKIALFLTTRTLPGKRDEVRAAWDRHLRPRVEVNAAQETYLFLEDARDPDVFHLFEIYAEAAAMDANARAPWFADYLAEVGPLLEGGSSMVTATPVWAKGVEI